MSCPECKGRYLLCLYDLVIKYRRDANIDHKIIPDQDILPDTILKQLNIDTSESAINSCNRKPRDVIYITKTRPQHTNYFLVIL